MAASCTFIKRASFILWMPVFLYRKSNKQLNVLRFCCAQIVTLLRVADTSGLCIDGLVFSDTRSEFMQNELTCGIEIRSLEQSRAEQSRANCALFASCGALETEYNIRDG